MEDRELGINLIIDGTSYPLTINASEEPYYRQAARLVNDKLSLYKELFMGEGSVRVMTMVALDIAFHSAKGTDEAGSAEVMHRINALSRILDDALKEKR
ncbi:MAG: cell division protein ZapA [Bacteroidales bacterium]|nr:cell division protein ZapA [Bacteroidales bacterium]